MLQMLFVSYTNVPPSFILIVNSIQEKQQKIYFLIHSNAYDDAIYFEVLDSWETQKSKCLEDETQFFFKKKKF